jgi:hypothetical protein
VIAIKLWAVISSNIIDICLVLIKLVTSLRVHFTNVSVFLNALLNSSSKVIRLN